MLCVFPSGIREVQPSADFLGELREVAFYFSDEVAAGHDFSHLGPLALAMRPNGTPRT